MNGSKRYVLDANVFIEAKNRYYGFNLCPGFWKALIAEHKAGRVCSIDRVRAELVSPRNVPGGESDSLSDWVKGRASKTFFKKTLDQAVIDAFQDIVVWVNSETQFTQAAKAEFAASADGWLVAYAKVNGLIIATHEVYAPDAKKRVPMPNVCVEFNVDCVDTFEMLEDMKVKFILRTKR